MLRRAFASRYFKYLGTPLPLLWGLTLCSCGGGSTATTPPPAPNPVPTIASVSPTSLTVGAAGATVTVTGSGFVSASTVQWNQNTRATTFVSATHLQFAITTADLVTAGAAQIVVVNPGPGGGTSPSVAFTINNPAPQISGISPSTVTTLSAGLLVTITGNGFVSNSSLTWNGLAHTSTYLSATQLQFTLAAGDVATVGKAQVSVSNPTPGGGSAPPSNIVIVFPLPVISSLNPATIIAGSAPLTLTISGSGFVATSIVQFNGASRATTYINPSTLSIALTANDVASPAAVQITVTTGPPGGGTSGPAPLSISTYPLPAMTSINPGSIAINSPDTLVTIQGTGFTSASSVQVNGSSLTPNGWNPNTLFFTLPAADLTSLGTLSITVSNPGPLTSNAITINVVPNPVSTLVAVYPASAALGGPSFTLTLSGSNFVPASVVQWNGSAQPTTFSSASQLTATIAATDTESLGNSAITVFNPTPGGGLSSAIPFTTYLALPANDLVYSQTTQLLYASVPSSGGPPIGNSIVPIDPFTGNLGKPIFVGSEPGKMALSSDGTTVWVALTGAAAVREVNLTTQTAGQQFSLGGGTGIYNPPESASALAIMPGQPNTLAVAIPTSATYSSVVTIYDSGVPRTNAQTGTLPCCSGVLGMVFDPTATVLYEAGSGYGSAAVNSTGITAATILNQTVSSNDLRVDTGRAYLTTGVILDANAGTQLGVFSIGPSQNAIGPVAPDSAIGKAFVLANPNFGSSYQINSYDLSQFVQNGAIPAAGVNTLGQNPSSLQRWGQDGLAFTTGTQVYILRSPVVRDLSMSLADLSVTASASASATTGTNLIYTLTASNAGPVAATPVTLIDNLPVGSAFQGATSSQGTCSGATVLYCNLGNLNAGASATVQINITPLTQGTLTNTATVSAPQGDPNTSNNTVVSSTAVTGTLYDPSPVMASINPAFVEAASGSFTLTVNGYGFASNSIVQLNSTALPTTFVSAFQLTATVDASYVAALGWAWVNVVNPAPGGGTSQALPLTTYQVISLDVNRLIFDPFTRKLYATVPSTATQVTGNALVAIDPVVGSPGTPLNVGSEPNPMAESTDGTYLYIGLDGSQSLTRVDLTSFTQGPVYPLALPGTVPPTPFAARDLAVAPGNNNLLAIDTGAFTGKGLFDISGSTGTFRPNLTGAYNGSNLVFANASTLYSYDMDTTGAEFYRWTVTASGLTLNDNTGYTLNGIGGFTGGFKLAGGELYGFGGGAADPLPTPPVQLGQFSIGSALGSNQAVEGTGVAPDPSLGRIFYLGETLAGSANPLLLSYDSNSYLLLGEQQFTGAIQGQDLVRWGRDGLAWHTSSGGGFGNGTPGSGQVFLVRGPFVLPEWGTVNPNPVLNSVSPSSAAAGSGNLTIAVTGSGFVPGVVLTWNGAERSTSFVDASHLTISIPASDLSHAGTATLVVNNPGSNNSSAVSFLIN